MSQKPYVKAWLFLCTPSPYMLLLFALFIATTCQHELTLRHCSHTCQDRNGSQLFSVAYDRSLELRREKGFSLQCARSCCIWM